MVEGTYYSRLSGDFYCLKFLVVFKIHGMAIRLVEIEDWTMEITVGDHGSEQFGVLYVVPQL